MVVQGDGVEGKRLIVSEEVVCVCVVRTTNFSRLGRGGNYRISLRSGLFWGGD